MKNNITTDVCIVGSGIVGLTVAWQLLERDKNLTIVIIDKESAVGKHSSGNNSGVIHAGIYYESESLKAKVCVSGAKRLRAWCEMEKLQVLNCGKVVTPQKPELDKGLDILLARGKKNGAAVEMIDHAQFHELVPDGFTSTGRALWVEDTCVVNPIEVVQKLEGNLKKKGVLFQYHEDNWDIVSNKNQIMLSDGIMLVYSHLFNCAGLQADRIAHRFGVGEKYTVLPFRGSYWALKSDAPISFKRNLYPVPDLEVPFLGVHVTPSIDGTVYLGPTAVPALGRENYKGFEGVELLPTVSFMGHMLIQFIKDEKMRRYIQQQAFEWLPKRFYDAAHQIVPKLMFDHIEKSNKVGIRPQLYNKVTKELVQDFILLHGVNSTHVINAISPAFTSSFELADYILDNSNFNLIED